MRNYNGIQFEKKVSCYDPLQHKLTHFFLDKKILCGIFHNAQRVIYHDLILIYPLWFFRNEGGP